MKLEDRKGYVAALMGLRAGLFTAMLVATAAAHAPVTVLWGGA